MNIDEQRWFVSGRSKANRLRTYLRFADRSAAVRCLEALWAYRVATASVEDYPDVSEAVLEDLSRLISRLGGRMSVHDNSDVGTVEGTRGTALAQTLSSRLITVSQMEPQARGYAFERFLKELFDAYGLAPQGPFRLQGEQIDGSLVVDQETYLLEAKWTNAKVDAATLHAFNSKVEGKSRWSRGLIVSQSGFTSEGLTAFGRGRSVIGMDGLDIYETLTRGLDLPAVIRAKVRVAAETGRPFIGVRELDLSPARSRSRDQDRG